MEAVITVVGKDDKVFPIPLTMSGVPAFVPQRGDQISIEGHDYVVEGVKWYHKQGLEWAVAVFVHEIVS